MRNRVADYVIGRRMRMAKECCGIEFVLIYWRRRPGIGPGPGSSGSSSERLFF
jgi:hypothetical protein